MVFLPLSNSPTLLAYSETRVQDFNAFRAAVHLRTNLPSFRQAADHPVVWVSWKEADSFCRWLTDQEQKHGQLGSDQRYRLPLHSEWLKAAWSTAQETNGPFAWGKEWPPPVGVGNLAREDLRRESRSAAALRTSTEDRFFNTAPAGSFLANEAGFVDMVGNASEWLADKLSGRQRLTIGGSWASSFRTELLVYAPPKMSEEKGLEYVGFRCVLVTASAAPER